MATKDLTEERKRTFRPSTNDRKDFREESRDWLKGCRNAARIYEPLPQKGAIRLLRIKPGQPDDKMECSLEVYPAIDHTLPYQALSYVWGETSPAKYIKMNGMTKSVTPNLYAVLKRLRPRPEMISEPSAWQTKDATSALAANNNSSDLLNQSCKDMSHCGISDGLVWIDALCINQDDFEERGHQVSFMGSIYSRAKEVIVWLGAEDAHVPGASTLLAKMAQVYTPTVQELGEFQMPSGLWDDTVIEAHGLPPRSSQLWKALGILFSSPWFKRVWVVQECALASKIRVHIGRYLLEEDDLLLAMFNVDRFGCSEVLVEHVSSLASLPYDALLWRHRMTKESNEYSELMQVLWSMKELGCVDSRDRIYASLALLGYGTHEAVPLALYPDYSRILYEVARDATRYMILGNEGLLILSMALRTRAGPESASWVMDLSHVDDREEDYTLPEHQGAGDEVSYLVPDPDCGDELHLRGYMIGRVTNVDEAFPTFDYQSSVNVRETILHWYRTEFGHMAVMRNTRILLVAWSAYLERQWQGDTRDENAFLIDLELCVQALEDHGDYEFPKDMHRDLGFCLWISSNRSLFNISDDCIGLGPRGIQVGDVIVTLLGSSKLYTLRPERDSHRYIGDCAIHGQMNEEWKIQAREKEEEPMVFVLR